MKTEKIAAALRCSSRVPGPQLDCRTCPYHIEETVDGVDYAGCDCDRIAVDAADRLEELVERCARYAEEIAVLRERMRPYEDTGLPADVCAEYRKFEDEVVASGKTFGRLLELLRADTDGRVAVLPCKELRGSVDGAAKKILIRGDRIRVMSDAELAGLFFQFRVDAYGRSQGAEVVLPDCMESIEKWLGEPVFGCEEAAK